MNDVNAIRYSEAFKTMLSNDNTALHHPNTGLNISEALIFSILHLQIITRKCFCLLPRPRADARARARARARSRARARGRVFARAQARARA